MRGPMRGAVILVLSTVLLVPTGARAGGWWSSIDPDRSTVAPGESLTLEAEFLFPSIQAANEAEKGGIWYAYLIADLDQEMLDEAMGQPDPYGWWALGDARIVRGAEATFGPPDANLATAKASFEVPDLAPGSYHVMFCDDGCLHSMGDVVPTEIEVVESAAVARLTRRLEKSQRQLRRVRFLAANASTVASSAIHRARAGDDDLEELARQLAVLQTRTARTTEPAPPSPSGWWVGMFLLLGAAAWDLGLRLRAWTSTYLASSKTS